MSVFDFTHAHFVFYGLSNTLFLYPEKCAFAQEMVLMKNVLKWPI